MTSNDPLLSSWDIMAGAVDYERLVSGGDIFPARNPQGAS